MEGGVRWLKQVRSPFQRSKPEVSHKMTNVILSISCGGNKLGAAFYRADQAKVMLVEDIAEEDDFFMLRTRESHLRCDEFVR